MSEDDIAVMGVLIAVSAAVTIVAMWQCGHISEETWLAAESQCAHGVKTVFLDGDYECKEGKK